MGILDDFAEVGEFRWVVLLEVGLDGGGGDDFASVFGHASAQRKTSQMVSLGGNIWAGFWILKTLDASSLPTAAASFLACFAAWGAALYVVLSKGIALTSD